MYRLKKNDISLNEVFQLSYDYYGKVQWTQIDDDQLRNYANGVTFDRDGDIYITGGIDSLGEEYNIIVRKYSIDGTILWNKIVYTADNLGDSFGSNDLYIYPDFLILETILVAQSDLCLVSIR